MSSQIVKELNKIPVHHPFNIVLNQQMIDIANYENELFGKAEWAWECLEYLAKRFCIDHCVDCHNDEIELDKNWEEVQYNFHDALTFLPELCGQGEDCPACAVVKALATFPWIAENAKMPPRGSTAWRENKHKFEEQDKMDEEYRGGIQESIPCCKITISSMIIAMGAYSNTVETYEMDSERENALLAFDMDDVPRKHPLKRINIISDLKAGQDVLRIIDQIIHPERRPNNDGTTYKYRHNTWSWTDEIDNHSHIISGSAENGQEFPTAQSVSEIEPDLGAGIAKIYSNDERVFQNYGSSWLVVYDRIPKSIKNMKGMKYIHILIQNSGKKIHAAVIQGMDPTKMEKVLGSAGKMIDEEALRNYKKRLSEIDEELKKADKLKDFSYEERLNKEKKDLIDEINRTTGLFGKTRDASSDRERHRKTVEKAVSRALEAINKEHESLWRHLYNCLKTGEFLSYQPDQPTIWIT